MKTKLLFLSAAIVLTITTVSVAQQQPKQDVYVAPNAPKDKPIDATENEVLKIEAAIKPYIEKARATYPDAKARFLKGLPPKHAFFVTTRLYDSSKRFEQVFIAVHEIKGGRISGLIATEIRLVSGYRRGDEYSFPEGELIDWTISKPDGTEEGNFVGNFLDTYQPSHIVEDVVWNDQPATPSRMNERIEEAAIDYAVYAPVPRIVLYDIGYPKNEQEYRALDGNAVILFTSITQNRDELPLRRVYALSDGKEVELKLLRLVLAELPAGGSGSTKVFGRFRADALYLLPMSVRSKTVDVLVDFQINRAAFKVATFDTPLPDDLKSMSLIKPSGAGPSESGLEAFIKREYPGFFQQ